MFAPPPFERIFEPVFVERPLQLPESVAPRPPADTKGIDLGDSVASLELLILGKVVMPPSPIEMYRHRRPGSEKFEGSPVRSLDSDGRTQMGKAIDPVQPPPAKGQEKGLNPRGGHRDVPQDLYGGTGRFPPSFSSRSQPWPSQWRH